MHKTKNMLAAERWATPYNLHPLSLYAIAYMSGILAQVYAGYFFALLLSAVISLVIWQHNNTGQDADHDKRSAPYALIKISCVGILFFFVGMGRFFYEKEVYNKLFSRSSSDRYNCIGRVCDIATYTHPYFKKRITLTIDSLSCQNDPTFTYQKTAFIYLYVPADENCNVDDEITIRNIRLKNPKNSFDVIRTMRSGVIALIFSNQSAYSIKKTEYYSWRQLLFILRSQTKAAVCDHLEKSIQPLYIALFLGNKTDAPITPYVINRFSLWGINHHLARSGLHLVIVVWLWLLCLQRLPISESSKYVLLALLGFSYYVLSWSSLSFDRACLSFLLYKICSYKRTSLDPMHVISLLLLLFLFFCPAHLLCLDFQLSFGLTYALAWFNHAHTKLTK